MRTGGRQRRRRHRRRRLAAVAVAVALAALAACSAGGRLPGNTETDRIARVVADAISYPRQSSADGLAQAAMATRAGQDGRLSVVVAEDLDAGALTDPLAHLVFRVHVDGSASGFASTEPVTACYDAEFDFYGVIGEPRRTECPASAATPGAPPG